MFVGRRASGFVQVVQCSVGPRCSSQTDDVGESSCVAGREPHDFDPVLAIFVMRTRPANTVSG
jgi:hypothetical protein